MTLYAVVSSLAKGLEPIDSAEEFEFHIPRDVFRAMESEVINSTTFSSEEFRQSVARLQEEYPVHICGWSFEYSLESTRTPECIPASTRDIRKDPVLRITIDGITRVIYISCRSPDERVLGKTSVDIGGLAYHQLHSSSSYRESTPLEYHDLKSDAIEKEALVTVERWVLDFVDETGHGDSEVDFEYKESAQELCRVTSLNWRESLVQALVEQETSDSQIRAELGMSRHDLETVHKSISKKHSEGLRLIDLTTPRKPIQTIPISADALGLDLAVGDLNDMDPFEFEEFVGRIWENDGYTVTQSANGADGGIDLVASNQHETIAIQVKKWSSGKVSEPTIRDVFGALHGKQFQHADRAIVVTTGEFTGPAQDFADLNDAIQLVDGDDLASIITGEN